MDENWCLRDYVKFRQLADDWSEKLSYRVSLENGLLDILWKFGIVKESDALKEDDGEDRDGDWIYWQANMLTVRIEKIEEEVKRSSEDGNRQKKKKPKSH